MLWPIPAIGAIGQLPCSVFLPKQIKSEVHQRLKKQLNVLLYWHEVENFVIT